MSGWERNLGVRWVTANVLGWLVGFALCNALQSFLSTFFVDGLVIGSAVGIAQWLVLRRPVSPRGGWVVASIIGFGLGSAMREVLLPGVSTVGADALSGAIIGLLVGLAQWVVLRHCVSAAGWWIPAIAAAWAIGWTAIGVAERSADWPTMAVYLVSGVGAAAAGIVTGVVLIYVLRSRAV